MKILPDELLARATSAQIGEIFAYYSLQNDEREAERDGGAGDVEADLKRVLNRK